MKQYSISTIKTSDNNKIVSDIDTSNLVSIVLNDNILNPEEYTIKDNKILFNNISSEDIIKLNYTVNTNNNLLSYGKSNNKSVLSKYNENSLLTENNRYVVGISIDKEIHEWYFNSKQNPMFTSSKKIFEDIGEFIQGFTEEYVNNKIYDNSVAVVSLIDELKENDIENVTYETDNDGFYTSSYKAVSNWVRYKTDIDLIMARYFGISYNYGSQLKEIGDIKIEKTVKLPYIDNLLAGLKKDFQLADDAIRGLNHVKTAVKAGTQYKYDDWDRDTTW